VANDHHNFRKIASNALFGSAAQVWITLLAIASTPVLLHGLGVEVFAIWMIVNVATGYFLILDFGLTRSTVKFLADHWSRDENVAAEAVLGTSLTLFAALALVGGAGVALAGYLLSTAVLDLDEALQDTATVAFALAGIAFFANMASAPLIAAAMARQRFDYLSARVVSIATVNSGGATAVVLAGFGLVEVLLLTTAGSVLIAATFAFSVRRLLAPLRLRPGFDRAVLRPLASFSGWRFMSDLSGQVIFQLDRVLISAFLPIAAVVYYSLPSMIVQRLLTFVVHLSNAAFPALSSRFAAGQTDEARQLYLRSSRLASIGMLPLCAFCAVAAEPVLSAWAGNAAAANGASTLRILAVGGFVATLSGVPSALNEAMGRPSVTAAFALLSAALSLTLGVILIPAWGIEGAAFAFLLSSAFQVPLFTYVTNRRLGLSHLRWLRETLAQPLSAVLLPAALLGIAIETLADPAVAFVGGPLFALAYGALAYRLALSDAERSAAWEIAEGFIERCNRYLAGSTLSPSPPLNLPAADRPTDAERRAA
jgi:O-antigen/teichoic acid export membrane protein